MTHLVRSDSFFGRIQRGLGGGYLEALERPIAEVERAVFRCLADDPRLNWQDESRELYYARLILERDIDEAPIGPILRSDPPRGLARDDRDIVPLGVLGFLGRAGRPDAIAMLRDYIAWGPLWPHAIYELEELADPSVWDGLDHALYVRFGPDPSRALADAWWSGTDTDPWQIWRERGPLAPFLRAIRIPEIPSIDLAELSIEQLLRVVRGPQPAAATLLIERARAGDADVVRLLASAPDDDDLELAANAIRVRAMMGDASIVASAERVLRRLGPRGSGLGRFKASVLRGFEVLDAPVALDVARGWRDSRDYRAVIAERLLERHAADEDLDWVLDRIRWAARTHRNLDPFARILRRFPGRGPFEGFEAIYRRYVPTCCRAQLIAAMSITDADFGRTLAYECLYDCEPVAREAAARTVLLEHPAAPRRLHAMSQDDLEDDEVKGAAARRLNT